MDLQRCTVIIIVTFTALTYASEDEECNWRGELNEEGFCICNPPYYGFDCEIDPEAIKGCQEYRWGPVCFDQGTCVNGSCQCNHRSNPEEIISGKFCECTNFLCDRDNGLLCGGPAKGTCECNRCNCVPGYSGSACECDNAQDNCIKPGSDQICSNNGRCVCNKCKCDGSYSGKWCHDCPTCIGYCGDFKDCVHCQTYGGLYCSLNHIEYAEKCNLDIEVVDNFGRTRENERLCRYFDEEGCSFLFTYSFDAAEDITLRALKKRHCAPAWKPQSVAEGRYKCGQEEDFVVSSRIDGEISPGKKYRWTFEPYESQVMGISCPLIEIPESANCRSDMLIVSSPDEHKTAKKLCGDVKKFTYLSSEGIKVSFKSSNNFTEIICRVACDADQLIQDPTTKAPLPLDTVLPVVNTCADLDPSMVGNCRCYDCEDHVSLHCVFRYENHIEIFDNYDFRVDIELELKTEFRSYLDLTGTFGSNADQIKYLKLCVHDRIHIPYSEILNLEAIILQDCRKSTFKICQMGPLDVSFQQESESPEETAGPPRDDGLYSPNSKKIIGGYITVPSGKDVPKLNQLYLNDVHIILIEGSLDFPNLRKLIINSDGGFTAKHGAFSQLPSLQVLEVKSCQETFESHSFELNSSFLREIVIEDKCVHSVSPSAMIVESRGTMLGTRDGDQKLKIHVMLNEKYFDHIPMCPFRAVLELDFTEITWPSVLDCRSCGGIWYWDLFPSQFDDLTASCFDPVSDSTMNLTNYTQSNNKLCSFPTGYTGTCIEDF